MDSAREIFVGARLVFDLTGRQFAPNYWKDRRGSRLLQSTDRFARAHSYSENDRILWAHCGLFKQKLSSRTN